jgi:hypothetical protein
MFKMAVTIDAFNPIAAHRLKKRDGASFFGYVHCGLARSRSGFGVSFRVMGGWTLRLLLGAKWKNDICIVQSEFSDCIDCST